MSEKENLLKTYQCKIGAKDDCKRRLEAATVSGILYLFGWVNFIFIGGKSENFEK